MSNRLLSALFITAFISALGVACAGCARPIPLSPASPGPEPAMTSSDPTPASASTYSTTRTGDIHDFDFLDGAWKVDNRRLKQRGVGSDDWDEFPATICATLYLDGVANVDELRFPTKGWAGLTVRTFDIARRQWSIYWISSRTGTLFPPVVGGFDGDRGEFYGEDHDDGRPVKVRFIWTRLGPDRAHWEQAFSPDGVVWEVNWTNELVRAEPAICATR